jgi:site-specific recombinase XerD
MIDDMTLRNMAPSTQKVYTYAVANFARYHRKSPDQLGLEDIRDYRLHLVARGLKATSINPIIGALRFFYSVIPTFMEDDSFGSGIPLRIAL